MGGDLSVSLRFWVPSGCFSLYLPYYDYKNYSRGFKAVELAALP